MLLLAVLRVVTVYGQKMVLFAPAVAHNEVLSCSAYNPPKVHNREGNLATVPIKPVKSTQFRCTSAELFFSCCGSAAALLVTALYTYSRTTYFLLYSFRVCLSPAAKASPPPPPSPVLFLPHASCLQAIYSREIAHMQVGHCGNQEAHAKVVCRRRRAARAIASRADLPNCRLSR
jgi:hypothetical protein